MEEYLSGWKQQVDEAYRRLTRHEPHGEAILALIAHLVADDCGELTLEAESALTHDMWSHWNQLAFDRPHELAVTCLTILTLERAPPPYHLPALRTWATWLVPLALDRWQQT